MDNYTTVHDTVKRTMTHIFSPRLSLTLDFANYDLIITKDGNRVERISVVGESLSLTEYERILKSMIDAANKLNKFTNG